MKTAIIFHRVDWDGYTSAAVALKAFPASDLIGWNYRDPLPNVDAYDRVILVDLTVYSTKPDNTRDLSWMQKNQSKLIWIDHHPIIHDVPGTYAGIQQEGIGACWLTYQYFNANFGLTCNTEHIKLAATFDTFRKDGLLCTWEDAWAYQLFLNGFGPGYSKEEGDRSKKLVRTARKLIESSDTVIKDNLANGYSREEQRAKKEAAIFEKNARRVIIGEHIGWLIECSEQPAMVVQSHSVAGDGDFFILYSEDKKKDGMYQVSVRVSDSSDFSAKAYAEAHGGGGHLKASGCVISEAEMDALKRTIPQGKEVLEKFNISEIIGTTEGLSKRIAEMWDQRDPASCYALLEPIVKDLERITKQLSDYLEFTAQACDAEDYDYS